MNTVNVVKIVTESHSLAGIAHIDGDKIIGQIEVEGEFWHGYDGAVGYVSFDNIYYDTPKGWQIDN